MTCKCCPYYYKNEDDDFACCHFVSIGPGDQAPCEYDDYEEPEHDEYD